MGIKRVQSFMRLASLCIMYIWMHTHHSGSNTKQLPMESFLQLACSLQGSAKPPNWPKMCTEFPSGAFEAPVTDHVQATN